MNQRERLAMYAYEYHGEWSQIAKAIQVMQEPRTYPVCENYITIYDDLYPRSLRQLRYPPWVLFYQGNLSLLNQQSITVIGSRNACEYGTKMTKLIVKELVPQYCIVSGLAAGIDGIAHATAIENHGSTIGVIGSGLRTQYPSCNEGLYRIMRNQYLILSEYPYDTPVKKHHFPWRNRILAALSKYVFVTQASCKSGTMLTVNEAIDLNREIYCVPYSYDSIDGKGCNLLIEQGANILYEIEQIRDLKR